MYLAAAELGVHLALDVRQAARAHVRPLRHPRTSQHPAHVPLHLHRFPRRKDQSDAGSMGMFSRQTNLTTDPSAPAPTINAPTSSLWSQPLAPGYRSLPRG
eukprot:847025-Pyramimonas_sp.AAC.2